MKNIFGLLFHPEVTANAIDDKLNNRASDLKKEKHTPRKVKIEAGLIDLLRKW